jgi:hypothetical protein
MLTRGCTLAGMTQSARESTALLTQHRRLLAVFSGATNQSEALQQGEEKLHQWDEQLRRAVT